MAKVFSKISRLVALGLTLAIITGLAGWLLVPAPKVDDFAVSPTLLDQRGRLYHARLSADGEWLLPVPLADMGPWLPKVAVAIEDKRFARHSGVDFLALGRAVVQNVRNRRVISGASTITVQVVRLSAIKKRTLFNKYVEFVQALKVERSLSKDEILEIYLNRAPFGGNLRGAEAAARGYFDKSAKDLSLGESALLVALLRGPSLYRPDRNPKLARARRDIILDRLVARGLITEAEAQSAKAEPILGRRGFSRKAMPRRAWHLAEIILAEAGGPETWRWGGDGREYGLPTSLNLDIQDRLELRLGRGLGEYPERITGAGAVMDNRGGAILAYVGNARWADEDSRRHWVDCARAPRSPGSALKPFIYLEAFAAHGQTPATMVADTPLKLAGQAPRNFDEYYRGPVSAGVALADSLNVPAVRMLRLVGQERAADSLRRLGFSYIQPGRVYGDSLALGGCEVDLWQMLKAYGTLARQGREVRPSWRASPRRGNAPPQFSGGLSASAGNGHDSPITAEDRPNEQARRLLSPGGAWLVNESLKDDSRLPNHLRLNRENSPAAIAFKTGTSHGLRDAWLAAYTPGRTIVLWAGDPSGQGHPDLVALKALGPVVVPLADDVAGRSNWPPPPDDLESYQACAISGQPAGPYCPAAHQAYRLSAGAQSHPCRIHILKGGQIEAQWPPELSGFMARLGRAAAMGGLVAISAPAITSPLNDASIILDEIGGGIPLKAEGAWGLVHWFVDDEFFKTVPAGFTPVLPLRPGRHRVSLVDGRGRAAVSDFTVLYSQSRDKDRDLPMMTF